MAVSHVSDTARWVAMYRALESERPDALFRDPWARKLAGPEGEAILREMPRGLSLSWPLVVRTQVIDEIVLKAVERDGVDTILNLAAGLDVRPYRLPLPASLRWVDADLPEILSHKQGLMAAEKPRCALEFAHVDLTDAAARKALFQRVGAASQNCLVISEGLLPYLTAEQVSGLAAELHRQASFQRWLFDLFSAKLLRRMNLLWGRALRKAPFLFGPKDGTRFFEASGWREQQYWSTSQESLRLQRTVLVPRMLGLALRLSSKTNPSSLYRMNGIALLKRA